MVSIKGVKGGSGLKEALRLPRVMLDLWPQRQMVWPLGGVCTVLANGTISTGAWGKTNIDDGIDMLVMGLRPLLTGMALWRGNTLGLPVDDKAGERKGVRGKSLPTMVLSGAHWARADDRDLMFSLAFDEQACIDIPRSEQVFFG